MRAWVYFPISVLEPYLLWTCVGPVLHQHYCYKMLVTSLDHIHKSDYSILWFTCFAIKDKENLELDGEYTEKEKFQKKTALLSEEQEQPWQLSSDVHVWRKRYGWKQFLVPKYSQFNNQQQRSAITPHNEYYPEAWEIPVDRDCSTRKMTDRKDFWKGPVWDEPS